MITPEVPGPGVEEYAEKAAQNQQAWLCSHGVDMDDDCTACVTDGVEAAKAGAVTPNEIGIWLRGRDAGSALGAAEERERIAAIDGELRAACRNLLNERVANAVGRGNPLGTEALAWDRFALALHAAEEHAARIARGEAS